MRRSLSLLCACAAVLCGCVTDNPPADKGNGAASEAPRKSSVRTETQPAQDGRPDCLKVISVPSFVRLHMADDALVVESAAALDEMIRSGSIARTASILIVHPGFAFMSKDVAKSHELVRANVAVPGLLGTGIGFLQIHIVMKAEDVLAFTQHFLDCVRKDGTWTIRAMTGDEMSRWWVFIGFDIHEPVFVVETENGAHRFVVVMNENDGSITEIDELNVLPVVVDGEVLDTPENARRIRSLLDEDK